MQQLCCSVCICQWEEMKDAVVTRCGHVFCWTCIFTWTTVQAKSSWSRSRSEPSCPTCKFSPLQLPQDCTPIYGHDDDQETTTSSPAAAASVSSNSGIEAVLSSIPPRPRAACRQSALSEDNNNNSSSSSTNVNQAHSNSNRIDINTVRRSTQLIPGRAVRLISAHEYPQQHVNQQEPQNLPVDLPNVQTILATSVVDPSVAITDHPLQLPALASYLSRNNRYNLPGRPCPVRIM